MSDVLGKQLLHRYILSISHDEPAPGAEDSVPQMEVITSFYRGHVDPAYKLLVSNMIDEGLFDEFISGVLQGLVYQGKSRDYSLLISILVQRRFVYILILSFNFRATKH